MRAVASLLLFLALIMFTVPAAPVRAKADEFLAIPETGLSKLVTDLNKLPISSAALQIGAHPDDEDNSLMAYLAKGLHLDTYYLVSNWGEGGQNEIGPELYEALGVLRSQELAAARAIDGAVQLYIGTWDFGFSKSAAETFTKWDHKAVLERTVEIIRMYQPEVILTHHDTVTGHGHHQAIGTVILEAFDAAANPDMFPEQITEKGLHPWQVKKLYVTNSAKPTVLINVGEYSPVLGKSFFEIGQLARSMHKCQGMGGAGSKGDKIRSYALVRSVVGTPNKESSVLDGIDVRFGAITHGLQGDPAVLAAISEKAQAMEALASRVVDQFNINRPQAVGTMVMEGLDQVRAMRKDVSESSLPANTKYTLDSRLARKESDFLTVARGIYGAYLNVIPDDRDVVPGQTFTVTAQLWNVGEQPIENVRLSLDVPAGWEVEGKPSPVARVAHNRSAEAKFTVRVPVDASYTDAYDPYPVQGVALWSVNGVEASNTASPELRVVPSIAVALSPDTLMVPVSDEPTVRSVSVKLRNNAKGSVHGNVGLILPAGWSIVTTDLGFDMTTEGSETSVQVDLVIPAMVPAGSYSIEAFAECAGEVSSIGYHVISYPHVDTRYLYRKATANLAVIDVKVAPGLKVGYVDSGFDNVPKALSELGVDVKLLTAEDLNASNLSQFDTIILGIRAYLSRPDLVANNARLLEYVKNGGNLIVQYNKTAEWKPHFAPHSITVSSNRVTVEEAPIANLKPDHPIFNAPNQIGPEDWAGWVQERGLYFPNKWDDRYESLVECNDPGEDPQRGSWLIAQYGQGTYIYTALVWYRQLDGLVPGGFRIFANMISLPKTQ